MPLPQHIIRRGQRLYYRRAFPKELWPVTGRGKSFVLSLRTDSLSEALRARPAAERAYHAAVDAACAEMGRRGNRPPLSKEAAQALAVRWFLDALETAEDMTVPASGGALEKVIADSEWAIAEARRAIAEGELADRERLGRCLRDAAGYSSEPVANAALVRLLGRAAVAAEEVYRGRLVGRYETRPSDPLFAAALDNPPSNGAGVVPASWAAQAEPEGKTVADLEEAYREERLPVLSLSAQEAYEPVLRLLKAVLGEGAPLNSLTRKDGLRLLEAAKGMPTNAKKRKALAGLTVLEAIEEGRRLGLPTLSPKTVNDTYLANLGALFRFAQDRGWMSLNPVAKLRVPDPVADVDRRDPFGAQLPALFGAAPWSPQDASEPIRYWGPLLALYHGLRLGEVAGLLVKDVGQEGGEPVLHLRHGLRKLKTDASRRDLPVHPELVRLGFLEWAEGRRKAAKQDETLFPGEKPYAHGKWGRGLSDWFGRRVKALGLQGVKLTFHSLRHDFKDAMREAEIDPQMQDYLAGHAGPGGVGAAYGGRTPSLARRKDAVGRVGYRGLALPGPR